MPTIVVPVFRNATHDFQPIQFLFGVAFLYFSGKLLRIKTIKLKTFLVRLLHKLVSFRKCDAHHSLDYPPLKTPPFLLACFLAEVNRCNTRLYSNLPDDYTVDVVENKVAIELQLIFGQGKRSIISPKMLQENRDFQTYLVYLTILNKNQNFASMFSVR